VVAEAGGVEAAHKMLCTTASQQALGLLWSLSATPGTLDHFTAEILLDIVRIGRTDSSGGGWSQTAALSALHNMLCYSGYIKVLDAGAVNLAVEVLDGAALGAQAAAALFLDQCCFDVRSKLFAVEALRVPVLVDILNRSRAAASSSQPSSSSSSTAAHALPSTTNPCDSEDEKLLGHVLSLMWNASGMLTSADVC
jgi:hypothetical protein